MQTGTDASGEIQYSCDFQALGMEDEINNVNGTVIINISCRRNRGDDGGCGKVNF